MVFSYLSQIGALQAGHGRSLRSATPSPSHSFTWAVLQAFKPNQLIRSIFLACLSPPQFPP
jgi:hypothetical protein